MLHHTERKSIGAGMYSYTKGAMQRALPANFASHLPLLCVLLAEDPALLGQGCPDGAYPGGDAAERYDQGEERFHY